MVEEGIWELPWEDQVSPATSSSLGQAMDTILSSRPRRLKAAIAELGTSPSKSASGALLDESLCFLWRHVEDAAKKEESLDHVLVPLIERFKDPKCHKQPFILMRWLCRNELLLRAILFNLAEIISSKSDHFTAFAWCTFVRSLVELSPNHLFEGEKEYHHLSVLRILCQSIPRLLVIACEGSAIVDGFELPTRLAVAAADCILVLTEALTCTERLSTDAKKGNKLVKLVLLSDDKESNQTRATDVSVPIGSEFILWQYLNELIILLEKLEAWSRKSLPLQEKGLKQVRKWLIEIKDHYSFAQDEAGGESLRNGALLLSSCWKQYGMLLRFDMHKHSKNLQVLDQYLSALEFYTQHDTEGDPVKVSSSFETRKFFLNCIVLFWGKLPLEKQETLRIETGTKLVNALLSQLKSGHEDLMEISVSIMRALFFGSTDSSFGGCVADTCQFQDILPVMLSLLDERDSAAKAVIRLMAEFCYVSRDGLGVGEIIKLFASGSYNQKKNAIGVIIELVRGQSDVTNKISPALWQDVASHLLDFLGDEELIDHVKASGLFPYLDPYFVLPRLVPLCYSDNEKVSSSSTSALASVLSRHNNDFRMIEILLDSLGNLRKNPDSSQEGHSQLSHSGSKLDMDRVLKLTPGWTASVKHFDNLVDQLIGKIFSDPSNPLLFRFMSHLSERLVEAGDLILHRVLLYMQAQESQENLESEGAIGLNDSVFGCLCPLLIIRLLPQKILDNLASSELYGIVSDEKSMKAQEDPAGVIVTNRDSIAGRLIERAFGLSEYEDVRKVAAELCGRLHPRVLIPTLVYHMKSASRCHDAVRMKACLFALCTSLVARGIEVTSHPMMGQILQIIDSAWSWPSFDADEAPKVLHGCIDCMALMICAEVQSTSPGSVLTGVIRRLASDCPDRHNRDELSGSSSVALRRCMAGILVSAVQKVKGSDRSELARRTLSSLIPSIQATADSETRIACLEVLYSAVYHLKSSVLPYSEALLKLALKALKKGSDKEKIAAAKLVASLMASEEETVERISAGLVEAKPVLAGISTAECSSVELRHLCEKLLSCLTSPLEGLFLGAYTK